MEMNNNGNNEKCAVNDDTTSDNSMIPIISPTSPKEGRKIVFINENERPHNKYWIESESEEVIEQENEDIDKLKSTIKRKSEKKKTKENWKKSVSNKAIVSLRVTQKSCRHCSNILNYTTIFQATNFNQLLLTKMLIPQTNKKSKKETSKASEKYWKTIWKADRQNAAKNAG